MSAKNSEQSKFPLILSNLEGVVDLIRESLDEGFPDTACGIVCVSKDTNSATQAFDTEEILSRILVIFVGLPIDPLIVQTWRNWAMNHNARDVRMAIMEEGIEAGDFKRVLHERCSDWNRPVPAAETAAIKKGAYVKMPDDPTPKDDSSLLTMMFGSMGELLTKIELYARRFKDVSSKAGFGHKSIKRVRSEVSKRLEARKPTDDMMSAPLTGLERQIDHFPKVMLYGDSGVGKTLIASYLQSLTGLVEGRPRRIPIPEYLGKEDAFEFDLFGYARGAYTGGKEEGDSGLLLCQMGGVIFLDEIGEANAMIQAKLLAFLDDYRVRPRGWNGESFHCPVLVVAATNKNLEKMVEKGTFRGDLLARFTDRQSVPSLQKRMMDIDFILDCLLQRRSLNVDGIVTEIGKGARDAIRKRPFDKGNFRELEDWFRDACERAAREGRHYLVAADVSA